MPSFLHIALTYWKHASVMSLLDLPLVSTLTFLEGSLATPDSGQVGGSSSSHGALSSLKPLDLCPRDLMLAFVRAQEDFFLFGSPCTLHDLTVTTSSFLIDVTSSLPLRLHVDQGLDRHGYPWVPNE
jgi:hypothetical protein